jgi:hypothetical protein
MTRSDKSRSRREEAEGDETTRYRYKGMEQARRIYYEGKIATVFAAVHSRGDCEELEGFFLLMFSLIT